MANIPNQNSISSIVAAHIKETTNIIDVVVNAAINNAIVYSSTTFNQVKTYSDVVNTLFNNNGAVTNLIKVAESFQKLDGKKINKENIDKGFSALISMQKKLKDFILELKTIDTTNIPELQLNNVIQIIKELNALKSSIEKDNKNKKSLNRIFNSIKSEITETIKLIQEISEIELKEDAVSKSKLLVSNINVIYKDIAEILTNASDAKENMFKTFLFKRKLLNRISIIIDVIAEITNKLDNLKVTKTNVKKLDIIDSMVEKLSDISKKILTLGLISVPVAIALIFISLTLLPAFILFAKVLLIFSTLIKAIKPDIDAGMKDIASIIVLIEDIIIPI